MAVEVTRKRRRHAQFWRACRFLGPYRRMVAVSIGCALLVGIVFTGGLSAMLPIFKLLLDDTTIPQWIDRQIVETRLDVTLSDEPDELRITRVKEDGFGGNVGLKKGDVITSVSAAGKPQPTPEVAALMLSLPSATSVDLTLESGQRLSVALPRVPPHLQWVRRMTQHFPTHPVKAIAAVMGFIFTLSLAGSTLRFFQEHLSDRAAILAVNDIRTRLYDHVLHLPMSFFGLKGTSDVTSRLVSDAQGLQEGFKTVLGQSIQEPIKATMALGLSMYYSWRLTLFILIFAPVMGLLIRKFGTKMRRASRKALQESSSMLGQIEATLSGIRVVKAANAERFERRRYRDIMRALIQHQIRMSRIDTLSTPTLENLALLVIGCVVLYAAYLVKVQETLKEASFFVVMACFLGMAESLRKMSKVNIHLQRANAAAGRIFETLDMPVERPRMLRHRSSPSPGTPGEGERLVKLSPIQREVRFQNVTFSYANASAPAVLEVDLTVPRGQSVAVVGRNGSGKTTLLALLPRFYDPQEGGVLIDGVDIRAATLPSLRRQISIVTQDPVIFPATIADNIAYGAPLATRQQVIDAAKRAFAHDFIMEKSDGYDTILGEMGGQLSGGQKQRINIARAILRQSPILILDEATSQVDAESEHLIQQAIEALLHERTTFVIAHRFSTILSADTIVVMDRGRIVGQGSHDQLLATCTTYQQLYERQLFIPAANGEKTVAQQAV